MTTSLGETKFKCTFVNCNCRNRTSRVQRSLFYARDGDNWGGYILPLCANTYNWSLVQAEYPFKWTLSDPSRWHLQNAAYKLQSVHTSRRKSHHWMADCWHAEVLQTGVRDPWLKSQGTAASKCQPSWANGSLFWLRMKQLRNFRKDKRMQSIDLMLGSRMQLLEMTMSLAIPKSGYMTMWGKSYWAQ